MKGSDFTFDCVHIVIFKQDESYIGSPDQIKNKKTTINPINEKDNKCFQFAVTVALNYEEIKNARQRITKIKPFIDKYNWKGINYLTEKKQFEKIDKIKIN